jgi:hypothetical protein
MNKLLRKGEHLTPGEERLPDLLSALVERYEDETEDFPASPPKRIAAIPDGATMICSRPTW